MSSLLIQNGRVIDPANHVDEIRDVWIENGQISDPGKLKDRSSVTTLDAKGRVVCPGFIDIHVHLREPGRSDCETIESGSRAAARGGFTSVVCMPNTTPSVDNAGTVEYIKAKAREKACTNVFPTGALTVGIKGELLSEMGSLKQAGVVALTDDGHCVQNNELMRRATDYAKMLALPIMDHCQDYNLSAGGVMHEGYWSMVLGLKGWASIAEEVIVSRNCLLSEMVEWPIHMQHMSTRGSVRILREARKRGVPVSGEICPHHIALTDESLKQYDTHYKMNPPLRTQRDIDALLEGVADGTLEILASDHAPHSSFEKETEFDDAPFGILGLETEVGLFMKLLVHRKIIDLPRLVAMYTHLPAKLLQLNRGTLSQGMPGDVTILDPDREWVYDKNTSASLSRNTPFHGWELKGKAVATIVSGKVAWSEM